MISVFDRASTSIVPRCDNALLTQERLDLIRGRIAQGRGHHAKLPGQGLLLGELPPLLLFIGQRGQRRDADDGAVQRVAKLVRAEDDVERLIPGHIAQRDVHRSLDRGVDDDVEPADLGKRPEHGAQIRALEVEADRVPGVGLAPGAAVGLRAAGVCPCEGWAAPPSRASHRVTGRRRRRMSRWRRGFSRARGLPRGATEPARRGHRPRGRSLAEGHFQGALVAPTDSTRCATS